MKTNDQQKTSYCLLPLVAELIVQQFPEWAHSEIKLEIKPVELDGMDNRTFRLNEYSLPAISKVQNLKI